MISPGLQITNGLMCRVQDVQWCAWMLWMRMGPCAGEGLSRGRPCLRSLREKPGLGIHGRKLWAVMMISPHHCNPPLSASSVLPYCCALKAYPPFDVTLSTLTPLAPPLVSAAAAATPPAAAAPAPAAAVALAFLASACASSSCLRVLSSASSAASCKGQVGAVGGARTPSYTSEPSPPSGRGTPPHPMVWEPHLLLSGLLDLTLQVLQHHLKLVHLDDWGASTQRGIGNHNLLSLS